MTLYKMIQDQLEVPEDQIKDLLKIGIEYQDNYISEEESNELIDNIDRSEWDCTLKRRVQHYGFQYDYNNKSIIKKIGSLPSWLGKVSNQLASSFFCQLPDQVIVNEYLPGQGIAQHIDSECFGPKVATISLLSDCIVKIKNPYNTLYDFNLDIVAKKRSLIVYSGTSRYNYTHGIPSRKFDMQDRKRIRRDRRISLTFRTIC